MPKVKPGQSNPHHDRGILCNTDPNPAWRLLEERLSDCWGRAAFRSNCAPKIPVLAFYVDIIKQPLYLCWAVNLSAQRFLALSRLSLGTNVGCPPSHRDWRYARPTFHQVVAVIGKSELAKVSHLEKSGQDMCGHKGQRCRLRDWRWREPQNSHLWAGEISIRRGTNGMYKPCYVAGFNLLSNQMGGGRHFYREASQSVCKVFIFSI